MPRPLVRNFFLGFPPFPLGRWLGKPRFQLSVVFPLGLWGHSPVSRRESGRSEAPRFRAWPRPLRVELGLLTST